MATATNKVTGVTVTADEAVIARLGPEWAPVTEKKAAPEAKPRARRKSDSK